MAAAAPGRAAKRRLSSRSALFERGNAARALAYRRREPGVAVEHDDCGGDAPYAAADAAMDAAADATAPTQCCAPGCNRRFGTTDELEAHYACAHRHRCVQCHRTLPTARLLDLHLSERHDAYFRALAARQPSYACLLDDCSTMCRSRGERRRHMTVVHCWPDRLADFDGDASEADEDGRRRRSLAAPAQPPSGAMDVDDLSDALSRSLRLPTTVSFGRRRRGAHRARRDPAAAPPSAETAATLRT